MLFHTWTFAVFFLIVYSGFLVLRQTRFWLYWLFVASYVFYGWWNPLYLLLILYSTTMDYVVVTLMERTRWRKPWLMLSLANNLLMLGFFKYSGFLISQFNLLLQLCGAGYRLSDPGILLPVGISFFAFQSLGYVIDYYRGDVEREGNLIRYATFVSFFPQLVAGPIERSRNLIHQLHHLPPITRDDLSDGLTLFLVGLFKKLAIANYLAQYVDPIYASPERYNAAALALATFAFAWEIYCDFSGYTDMARGIARVMGFRLILNFDHPYLATGLGDFWARWHISLSSWFRDYVYIPLGGNQGDWLFTARNLFLTMLISGLWHGANWTFIIWGALHGAAYVLTRNLERTTWYRRQVPNFLKQLIVFAFVCFTWIFFRATSVEDAGVIIAKIFSPDWGDPQFPLLAALLVGGLWGYEFVCESRARWVFARPAIRIAVVVSLIVYLSVATGTGDVPFIYFQF
ncbi:MAG: MBOAT family O-acyltransferase [Planctomycetaceae bacterium]